MTSRRGFLGQLMGVLAGAAVGPIAIKATELPPAAALSIPPAAPVTPAVVYRLVLTNEAIANEALRLLRENLAFVRAKNIGPRDYWSPGDLVHAPEARFENPLDFESPPQIYQFVRSGYLQQSGVNLSWRPNELRKMSLAEYSRAQLAPAMQALASRVAGNMIGSRELVCVGQPLPSSCAAVRASADDFSLRLVHDYDILRDEFLTRIDLAYAGVR